MRKRFRMTLIYSHSESDKLKQIYEKNDCLSKQYKEYLKSISGILQYY
jgi:hypothetical protein